MPRARKPKPLPEPTHVDAPIRLNLVVVIEGYGNPEVATKMAAEVKRQLQVKNGGKSVAVYLCDDELIEYDLPLTEVQIDSRGQAIGSA